MEGRKKDGGEEAKGQRGKRGEIVKEEGNERTEEGRKDGRKEGGEEVREAKRRGDGGERDLLVLHCGICRPACIFSIFRARQKVIGNMQK